MMQARVAAEVEPALWIDICPFEAIVPSSGVCALVDGEQIALVRVGASIYAVDNFDPFSRAYVIARGIVGEQGGVPTIASPIYKQRFDLRSGQCLDDASVKLRTWPARVRGGVVEVFFDGR